MATVDPCVHGNMPATCPICNPVGCGAPLMAAPITAVPVITALDFSRDDDRGWNLHGSGHVSGHLFGNALQVWAWAQNRPVTVADAALAFNVAPHIIHEAIDNHAWLFLGPGGVIEHEGE